MRKSPHRIEPSPKLRRCRPAMSASASSATISRTGIAFLGCELNVSGPTFVGDTLHVEGKVVEIRPASKGNRALVRTENRVVNQKGETVLTYNPLRMMKGRPE